MSNPQNNTTQHPAQHSTTQHSTAQHSTAQHSTAQHSTAQHRAHSTEHTAHSTQHAAHSTRHAARSTQHTHRSELMRVLPVVPRILQRVDHGPHHYAGWHAVGPNLGGGGGLPGVDGMWSNLGGWMWFGWMWFGFCVQSKRRSIAGVSCKKLVGASTPPKPALKTLNRPQSTNTHKKTTRTHLTDPVAATGNMRIVSSIMALR